jgi:hypothetical protein
MARVQTPRSFAIPIFYNVDAPVGGGQTNRPDDVALVQFLLNVAWRGQKLIPELADSAPSPDIATDGIFGPLTEKKLALYQLKMDKTSLGFLPGTNADGIVHPAKGFALTGRGVHMTITNLNVHFQKLRPGDFLQLGIAADLPPILAKSQLCI